MVPGGGVGGCWCAAWVSPAHARPVPGISYDHVPTSRASQIGSTPPCTGQQAWTVQHLPHRPGAILIHVVGCTPSAQMLNREQALTALRQPRAAACRECGAAGSLADHNESPDQVAEAPTLPRVPG
ncbi:DUF6233 domain-containing protein (plasmid) [Streptomyces sp. HUAS TT11]|uniref:DUF6233 domain-containing protein n=1 Tax=Streptomyces sp. HUAS TT11 TaxID=3447508 RepID=UPI003F6564A9